MNAKQHLSVILIHDIYINLLSFLLRCGPRPKEWASNEIRTHSYRFTGPDLAPCDFCLFPKIKEKLRGCRYETIEEMKEAVTKVIDTLTQEDFH